MLQMMVMAMAMSFRLHNGELGNDWPGLRAHNAQIKTIQIRHDRRVAGSHFAAPTVGLDALRRCCGHGIERDEDVRVLLVSADVGQCEGGRWRQQRSFSSASTSTTCGHWCC